MSKKEETKKTEEKFPKVFQILNGMNMRSFTFDIGDKTPDPADQLQTTVWVDNNWCFEIKEPFELEGLKKTKWYKTNQIQEVKPGEPLAEIQMKATMSAKDVSAIANMNKEIQKAKSDAVREMSHERDSLQEALEAKDNELAAMRKEMAEIKAMINSGKTDNKETKEKSNDSKNNKK